MSLHDGAVAYLNHMDPPRVLMPCFALRETGSSINPWPITWEKMRANIFFDTKVGKTEPKVSEDGKPPIQ